MQFANMAHLHPLDPATAPEIELASSIVKNAYEGTTLHFKAGGLEGPSLEAPPVS